MDRDLAAVRWLLDEASRQQGDAEAGAGAGHDGVERGELEPAQPDDAAPPENIFQALAVGAAGAQDHDPDIAVAQEVVDLAHGPCRDDDELLAKNRLVRKLGMLDRAAHEG